ATACYAQCDGLGHLWDGFGTPYGTVKIVNVCRPWDGGTPDLPPSHEKRNYSAPPGGPVVRCSVPVAAISRFQISEFQLFPKVRGPLGPPLIGRHRTAQDGTGRLTGRLQHQ